MTSKGGDQTTTEKSETTYPQWSQTALQNLTSTGTRLTSPFLQTPSYGIAGFNPDQLKGFDLARQSAMGAYLGGTTSIPTAGSGYDPATVSAVGYTPSSYTAEMSRAAQVDGDQIQKNLNPYVKNVVENAKRSAWVDRNRQQADIGQRAAAAGAFGGSREALERGKLDENYQNNVNTMVSQLMSDGYDKATALAQANAAMRQQTSLANQAATNAERQTNAGWQTEAAQYLAGAQNSANGANAAAKNVASQFGLNNAQSMAQLQDALRSNDLNRQLQALQVLLGTGAAQQALGQSALEVPFTNLQRLLSVTPQSLDSTTTTKSTTPKQGGGLLGGILGAGASILGMDAPAGGSIAGSLLSKAGFLSDEKTKTNKRKIGEDPNTGVPIYSYDYRDDVAAAKKSGKPMGPKRIGPMAQDVEKAFPGSTRQIGGNLAILMGV